MRVWGLFLSVMVISLAVIGCDDGNNGDSDLIMPIADQTVNVNDTLVVDLRVRNSLGDEEWSFSAPSITDIDRTADLYQSGGMASFRWVPLASHSGSHQFTFTLTNGEGTDSETITIEVLQAGGAPRFIQPPPGGTYDLEQNPCIDVDIEVIDEDSQTVEVRERPPLVEGGELNLLSSSPSHRARWHWCPKPQQVDNSLRYTLHLEADDGEHPPVRQSYAVLLLGTNKPDCDTGAEPTVTIESPADGSTLATIRDYEIVVSVSDDQGLKEEPALFYSTSDPGDPPAVTEMDVVSFTSLGEGRYQASIPNLGLEEGRSQTIYYVVSATDNDDPDGTSCDHTTRSEVRQFVAAPPETPDFLGYCEPCSADRQCESGFCVVAEPRSFCVIDCGDGCTEGVCQEVASRGGSAGEQCVPETLRCDGVVVECTNDDGEPDNDEVDTASTVALGATFEGMICANDIDFFGVNLTAGVQYDVSVTGWDAATSDLDIALLNPEDEFIGYSETIEDIETFQVCSDLSGEHFLAVFGYSEVDQGPYVGAVTETDGECCSDDGVEPNDTFDEASSIVCGVGGEGTICPFNDDYWQIRVEEPSTLNLYMICDAESGDLDLQLFNTAGSQLEISESNECEEEISVALPAAGNYYARVSGYGASSGFYLIDCEMTAGSVCSSTSECPAGSVCDPAEGCVDEECFFTEDCPAGHLCPEPGGVAPVSLCSEECSDGTGCRPGYACKIFDEGRGCAPAGPGLTGAPCERFSDCAGERTCLTAGSDGYCAEINCAEFDDCPEDSYCVSTGERNICLEDCAEGDEFCDDNLGSCTTTNDVDGYVVYVCALDDHSVPTL